VTNRSVSTMMTITTESSSHLPRIFSGTCHETNHAVQKKRSHFRMSMVRRVLRGVLIAVVLGLVVSLPLLRKCRKMTKTKTSSAWSPEMSVERRLLTVNLILETFQTVRKHPLCPAAVEWTAIRRCERCEEVVEVLKIGT
jgi:hypothetical protein